KEVADLRKQGVIRTRQEEMAYRRAGLRAIGATVANFNELAEKAKKIWEKVEPVKEAKEAVDKAKEFSENGLTAKERKLGDTVKEYMDQIKMVYENVKRAMDLRNTIRALIDRIFDKDIPNVMRELNYSPDDRK